MIELNNSWQNDSQNSEETDLLIAEKISKDRCGVCNQRLIVRTFVNPQDGRPYLLVECQEGHIRYRPPKEARWD